MFLVVVLASIVNSMPLPAMFAGLPIHWNVLGLATLALGLVAVGSALPPARQAADMTPVEELRPDR
jgi:ABC-type antimicrobial peptide transport system permease subunit